MHRGDGGQSLVTDTRRHQLAPGRPAWFWRAVLAAAVATLYSASLSGGFLADDWAMIAGNEEQMRGFAALRRFFTGGMWESSNLERVDTALYRPVWLVWNFALYNLVGEDPFWPAWRYTLSMRFSLPRCWGGCFRR